jgi:hypothetical protein
MTNSDRWTQIYSVFQKVLELHPHQRQEFLDRVCGEDSGPPRRSCDAGALARREVFRMGAACFSPPIEVEITTFTRRQPTALPKRSWNTPVRGSTRRSPLLRMGPG